VKGNLNSLKVSSKVEPCDIEIELLLEAIFQTYGYDFRDYSRAHIKRRILHRLRLSQIESISLMQHRLLREPGFASDLIRDFSINVTEMFRDPEFYQTLRERIIQILKTWSFLKIWHAGCSTGEEVYSTAILLMEEGLYDRVQIYATDFNTNSLKTAKEGIFPIERIKKYTDNYDLSRPKGRLSDYYLARYDSAIINNSLKKNIIWANHNLVTDHDFTETNMIMCRNVLIYFNRKLQDKVIALFYSSLVKGGILCLGNKESLINSSFKDYFEEVDKKHKIFKKKYSLSDE
jgi:chemotaxis protein methyltransferase CheR